AAFGLCAFGLIANYNFWIALEDRVAGHWLDGFMSFGPSIVSVDRSGCPLVRPMAAISSGCICRMVLLGAQNNHFPKHESNKHYQSQSGICRRRQRQCPLARANPCTPFLTLGTGRNDPLR